MMVRDITSQSADGTQPADGRHGRAPVVVISNKVFNDNYEMGQMNVSHGFMCFIRADFPLG